MEITAARQEPDPSPAFADLPAGQFGELLSALRSVVEMNIVKERGSQAVLDRIPGQVLPGGIEEGPVPHWIDLEDDLSGAEHQRAIQRFTDPKCGFRSALLSQNGGDRQRGQHRDRQEALEQENPADY